MQAPRKAVETYDMKVFAQANPKSNGPDSVPVLLRRVANSIDSLGDIEVHDLILSSEVTEFGQRYTITVYFFDEEL